MSFSDAAERLKKIRGESDDIAEEAAPLADPSEMSILRTRIMGVLIRDARLAKGYSIEELADLLQTSADDVVLWEFGNDSPSLPQLELLAYWLEVPITHFMTGTETLEKQFEERKIDQKEYQEIRNRMIAAVIRDLREKAGFTTAYLAEQTKLDENRLRQYEFGLLPIPLGDLTKIASGLRVTISQFLEGGDRVGSFLQARELVETFLEMSPELRQFVATPSSLPYLELAMKLSEIEGQRLREIAESILEITY